MERRREWNFLLNERKKTVIKHSGKQIILRRGRRSLFKISISKDQRPHPDRNAVFVFLFGVHALACLLRQTKVWTQNYFVAS